MFSTSIIPENWSLIHYRWLFDTSQSNYLLWYKNSLIVAFFNTIFSVTITTLVAYAFSRFKFVGRKNGIYSLLVVQMFPVMMGMAALYIMVNLLGLLDTLTGFIIIYVGGSIPMHTFLVKGYFDTIPRELDESAKIDGASHMRIFFTIMLPLAKPIIAVIAMFNYMAPFMDFLLPRILLRNPENFTLAMGLYNLINNGFGNNFTRFAAGSILIAVPIAAVYLYLQKHLILGLTAGATKG